MSAVTTFTPGKPVWVDLAVPDVESARTFYEGLFGWEAVVPDDPQAGGYVLFRIAGRDAAGVAPVQGAGQPPAWSVYIGTADADETAKRVAAAGGTVVAPPFDVMDQGRMGVFQDPSGAFVSVWQATKMQGIQVTGEPGSFGWAELNSRGLESVKPFYKEVFGWDVKSTPMGEGLGDYTEWLRDGQSVAGGMEMSPMVPAEVPSYWLVYFSVADVDKAVETASALGARVLMPAAEYPGGRFAIFSDPQGAAFGVIGGA